MYLWGSILLHTDSFLDHLKYCEKSKAQAAMCTTGSYLPYSSMTLFSGEMGEITVQVYKWSRTTFSSHVASFVLGLNLTLAQKCDFIGQCALEMNHYP